jgi:glycerophosphoryl diester phosphodiesterase
MTNIDPLLNRPIAHRGLHDNNNSIPENSLPAFEKALDAGYPIELDVRVLKDNTVVVFHDRTTKRLTNEHFIVEGSAYNKLKQLSLIGSDAVIPKLIDVLDLIQGRVPVLVEIKNENRSNRIEKEVYNIIRDYQGFIAVQSFNPYSVLWFKKFAPQIPRGQVSSDFSGVDLKRHIKFILKNMLYNFKVKPDFITYDIRALPNWRVGGMRKAGIPIIAWTINDKHLLDKAANYADNFIFENITPVQ